MTDVSATFGFEIIQKLYDNEIQKKEDVIILFIHWYLIKSGFRCIGIGNEVSLDQNVASRSAMTLKFYVSSLLISCSKSVLSVLSFT